uniref:Uncharacterized protein n=1 Tax=Aegilops tauschii subsp. strangulata TaxID=200361 RepID=A0A453L4Y1_AEGTS
SRSAPASPPSPSPSPRGGLLPQPARARPQRAGSAFWLVLPLRLPRGRRPALRHATAAAPLHARRPLCRRRLLARPHRLRPAPRRLLPLPPRRGGRRQPLAPSWDRSRGKASAPGSPMDGVVEPPPRKELLALPPPSSPCTPPPPTATAVTPATEAARTEPAAPASEGKADGEEWVTVFGHGAENIAALRRFMALACACSCFRYARASHDRFLHYALLRCQESPPKEWYPTMQWRHNWSKAY